jgi:hypothetical protein
MEIFMTTEERTFRRIRKKLAERGPVLPGSLSVQWNVCGTRGCRCKDPEKPVKHGPSYQLSFTVAGKSSTMFIRKEDVAEAKRRIERYAELKKLTMELVEACVVLARKKGLKSDSA